MLPEVIRDELERFVIDVNRIHQFAVDVELELPIRSVPNSNRAGFFVAFEVSQDSFFEILASVDAIHELERRTRLQLAAALFDPASEGRSFALVTETHQRIQRERCIANPGVAVIPVSNSTNLFRQTEGRRCDDGTILL